MKLSSREGIILMCLAAIIFIASIIHLINPKLLANINKKPIYTKREIEWKKNLPGTIEMIAHSHDSGGVFLLSYENKKYLFTFRSPIKEIK